MSEVVGVAVHLWSSPLNLPNINDGSVINNIRRRCGRLINLTLDHYLFTDARHGFHFPGLQKDVITEKPDLTLDHELHLFLRLILTGWCSGAELRRSEAVDTRKAYGLLAYLAVHLMKQVVQA